MRLFQSFGTGERTCSRNKCLFSLRLKRTLHNDLSFLSSLSMVQARLSRLSLLSYIILLIRLILLFDVIGARFSLSGDFSDIVGRLFLLAEISVSVVFSSVRRA